MTSSLGLWRGLSASAALGICLWAATAASDPVEPLPGMLPVTDPVNVYGETGSGRWSAAVEGALPRVYVPNVRSNEVYVIDPGKMAVVDRFRVGTMPQHIVPSWDLKTLWVNDNGRRRGEGSLIPIDPKTAKPGPAIHVDDPYNLYFTPDGRSAIVVAERLKRLDFRDPHTMVLQQSLPTPDCAGVNHADFAADGSYAIFTCEFSRGGLIKVDLKSRQVIGHLNLSREVSVENAPTPGTMPEQGLEGSSSEAGRGAGLGRGASLWGDLDPEEQFNFESSLCGTGWGMPQDVRISPDGKLFYIADMLADGVFLVDADAFKQVGFIPTGVGTHGLYPSRDGTKLYVSNRGSHSNIRPKPRGPGSISVIDFATGKVVANWPIPGGGSPDMGNLSADGKQLWLSGRYDNVVYAIDTDSGAVTTIPVGHEPHGLTVWPQPGRYSLGHTGNMR
jgi:YVTN family beta-propeller protein